jgi:hypothetical protein
VAQRPALMLNADELSVKIDLYCDGETGDDAASQREPLKLDENSS